MSGRGKCPGGNMSEGNVQGEISYIRSLTICTNVRRRHCNLSGDKSHVFLLEKWPNSCLASLVEKVSFNALTVTLKLQSIRPLYSNTAIGTLTVDGWAVTFGTARRDTGGCGPSQSPHRCTKRNSQPINGQCTNFTVFDVALSLPVHNAL